MDETTTSSYPIYFIHRKLWAEYKEERKTIIHTHKWECGQSIDKTTIVANDI